VKVGDHVEKDQIIAETKSFFGMFKSECKSPTTGTVETVSHAGGSVGIRQAPLPIEVKAYIAGKVAEVIPSEGVVVETRGALIQGIFGVGGERTGIMEMVSADVNGVLDAPQITPEHAGKILVGGANVTGAALRKASAVGVVGLIAGGLVDKELVDFLGYDIGVAITGHENITITVVVTEGFGSIPMARRTFDLFASLSGKMASINGATQIRAGVIRPEVVVPLTGPAPENGEKEDPFVLQVGTSIRVIREPYFGLLGAVTGLPPKLVRVDSGAEVRVLDAKLADGRDVTVPRANVEIIAS